MHWPLVLEVMGWIPATGDEKIWCPNMLSLVSFTGMTLNKCAVLWIGTVTGGHLCRLKIAMTKVPAISMIPIYHHANHGITLQKKEYYEESTSKINRLLLYIRR